MAKIVCEECGEQRKATELDANSRKPSTETVFCAHGTLKANCICDACNDPLKVGDKAWAFDYLTKQDLGPKSEIDKMLASRSEPREYMLADRFFDIAKGVEYTVIFEGGEVKVANEKFPLVQG